MNIIKLESVNSTNTYCNYLLTNPEGLAAPLRPKRKVQLPLAVIAREQYAGRGRYGNFFHSPKDSGIYLSYAFEGKYEINDLLKITMVAASIVHKVLSNYTDDALSIKWINDIYRNNRKIAGILAERIDNPNNPKQYYIIVGIGINVFSSILPKELENIAGFLCDDSPNDSIISNIADNLITSLNKVFSDSSAKCFPELLDYYENNCLNLPI